MSYYDANRRFVDISVRRLKFVGFLLLLSGITIILRLFFLQIIEHDRFTALARNQHLSGIQIPARRGEILARDPHTGNYFKLATRFESGNIPTSFEKELIVDSSLPKVALEYTPELFSPDDDGENDILTIYPEVIDNSAINEWKINIYEPSGEVFKSYKGTGLPAGEIKWDGIGIKRDIVESAADYFIVLSATDLAGNASETERIKLPIDVLVIVTERGLKIRVSNIEFAFDKAELRGRAFPILDRVAELLNKYLNYSVIVEGHTDDIGKEEYNLKLSEARAKSVTDYLISEDIDESRLQFRGMGETVPFLPNKNAENRRRNRRVEFLLLKEGLMEQEM